MNRILLGLLTGIITATAGSVAATSITFYQDDNFRGRQMTADRAVTNFSGTGFNDGVRSAVVHDGRWEICFDADFQGNCSILTPGAYPDLGAYAGRISSVRPSDAYQANSRPDGRGRDRDRDRQARATLYENSNLSGRSYELRNAMPNMGGTGLNDRASSLRVETGYWIFCSDADFRGECRTFGPGDYVSLPGMNDRISSGRMISNEYPYADRPDWQRGWNRQSQYQPK
jgi:hypothetical protein